MFGTGNATQVNTITTAVNSALMNYHVISKDAIPDLQPDSGYHHCGTRSADPARRCQTDRTGNRKARSVYGSVYIVLAIGVNLLNLTRIPSVFVSIIEGAFRPSAVTGGIVGVMLMKW